MKAAIAGAPRVISGSDESVAAIGEGYQSRRTVRTDVGCRISTQKNPA
jgi:hypothetical protein